MNAIQLTAKLYECRDAARSLLGAHYTRDMDLWAEAIRGVAAQRQCSELAAANDMARDAGGFGAIVVLAAYVEMSEPSEPSAGAPAQSAPQTHPPESTQPKEAMP